MLNWFLSRSLHKRNKLGGEAVFFLKLTVTVVRPAEPV